MSHSPGLYLIGCAQATGCGPHKLPAPTPEIVGFKAYNLLRMAQLGLPVPAAFVLATGWCADAALRGQAALPSTWHDGLQALQTFRGQALGDSRNPLLLSVRSGASVSMPGMMETLLNIGLCDATLPGLLRQTGHPRLVWDAYRRLVSSYGEVVAGLEAEVFDQALQAMTAGGDERELDFAQLRELTRRHLLSFAQHAGRPFPQDPHQQLSEAIAAVMRSWLAPKAQSYRRLKNISDSIGTAVTVQAMVFGNCGGRSGAGVGFTRDPATGEAAPWVDFLFNAQGEDVVSGRRSAHGHDELALVLPDCWQALVAATHQLEKAFGDMQDFEFTVQEGRLYLLQTRTGKRTLQAAARIALDLHDEGIIDRATACQRTLGLDARQLSHTQVVSADGLPLHPLAQAASASAGVAMGEIALDEARAKSRHDQGVPVVLVRRDAETSDLEALELATGLLTQRGARTSHAAVVARQLGKVCLVGCSTLQLDLAQRSLSLGEHHFQEGDWITLDGNTGQIYTGAAQTRLVMPDALLERLARLRAQDSALADQAPIKAP
jgi:pyruvate,orthophosphate dikinase